MTNYRFTARRLIKEWNIGVQFGYYHHKGTWFHVLERFPGALIDDMGYIIFKTKIDYYNCPNLSIGIHTNVLGGISNIPGYILVIKDQSNRGSY